MLRNVRKTVFKDVFGLFINFKQVSYCINSFIASEVQRLTVMAASNVNLLLRVKRSERAPSQV